LTVGEVSCKSKYTLGNLSQATTKVSDAQSHGQRRSRAARQHLAPMFPGMSRHTGVEPTIYYISKTENILLKMSALSS